MEGESAGLRAVVGLGREVGFKSALPHDFFRNGLQVNVRGIVGHEVS